MFSVFFFLKGCWLVVFKNICFDTTIYFNLKMNKPKTRQILQWNPRVLRFWGLLWVFVQMCLPWYPSANAWLFEYWDFSMLTSSSICDTQEHGTTKGVLTVTCIGWGCTVLSMLPFPNFFEQVWLLESLLGSCQAPRSETQPTYGGF